MTLGLAGGGMAFQHLLYEVDAPPGSIQFIPGQLIGRTGCVAETAVHTVAQDFICFHPGGGFQQGLGQGGLHALQVWIHPARIENSGGVKTLFEALVQGQHGWL